MCNKRDTHVPMKQSIQPKHIHVDLNVRYHQHMVVTTPMILMVLLVHPSWSYWYGPTGTPLMVLLVHPHGPIGTPSWSYWYTPHGPIGMVLLVHPSWSYWYTPHGPIGTPSWSYWYTPHGPTVSIISIHVCT